jgi:DNA polymerase-3 subunit gamma/tau
MFATTEHHKIPDTILSRCQEFEFRTVAPAEIGAQLQKISRAEGIEISDAALATLARAAAGSLRDGISALDQVIAATGKTIEERDVTELLGLIERDVLRETTEALIGQDTAALLAIVDGLSRGGRDYRYFTTAMMGYLRDVLVAKVAPSSSELMELPGETSQLQALAERFSEEDLLRALDVLTQTEEALRTSPEPRFHLEMALLKLSQLGRLASFEELLARFEAFVSGETPAPPSTPTGSAPKTVSKPKTKAAPPRASSAAPTSETSSNVTAEVAPSGESAAESTGSDFIGRLVNQLKASKPMLHALVAHNESACLDGDRLTLSYLPERKALAEQLQQKALQELLEDQASSLLGRTVRVAVELVSEAKDESAAPPPSASPGKSEDLRERADRDPLVRQFVDTFQGEIERVEKPDP